MRVIPAVIALLSFVYPAVASGQSFQVQGSAGGTVVDSGHNLSYGFNPGHSLAAGIGFRPTPRLTLLVDVERIRRASQRRLDARGNEFGFRGGTLTMAEAQLRVALFGPERIGPYGIVGFAAGQSRLNVSESFPDAVSNDARAVIFGGGIHVPLRDRLSLFADGRMIIGTEANELLAVMPIRAGLAWRF